jgi:hypothetical protein
LEHLVARGEGLGRRAGRGRSGFARRRNGASQRIHDVAQATRLGPGLAFGSDADDAHTFDSRNPVGPGA